MADTTRIRIAVSSSRELEFEVEDAEAVVSDIQKALDGGDSLVWVVDSKGHSHGIRVDNLAFVEVENDDDTQGVGF